MLKIKECLVAKYLEVYARLIGFFSTFFHRKVFDLLVSKTLTFDKS